MTFTITKLSMKSLFATHSTTTLQYYKTASVYLALCQNLLRLNMTNAIMLEVLKIKGLFVTLSNNTQ
jgi:hypothetical protein